LTAGGALSGSVQPLTAHGPLGIAPLPCEAQPSELAMNARNFLAASSLAPVVVVGM
jgi:hypothetical protein